MRSLKCLLALCMLVAATGYGGVVHAAPQTGWWWNPAESGRGFFVESDGGITFIGVYVYGADGHADWLVTGGPNPDPYNYTGQLYSMRNGQTLFGGYVAPVGPDSAGTLSVHFTDDTHGVVTWPGGTTPIERHIFGGTDALFQPASGWWWNPNESGSGYSIEVQGDNLFFVGFTYDEAGRPVWYFSAGPMNTLTTYTGSLLQFANGQTVGGPYHPPGTPAAVGNLAIDFESRDRGTITFTTPTATALTAQSVPKASGSRRTRVQTQFPRTPPPAPAKYLGKFLFTDKYTELSTGAKFTDTWSGDLVFEPCVPWEPEHLKCYRGRAGSIILNRNVDLVVPSVGGTCHRTGVAVSRRTEPETAQLGTAPLLQNRVWDLVLEHQIVLPWVETCTVAGQSASRSGVSPVSLRYVHTGTVQNILPGGYVDGNFTDTTEVTGAFYYVFLNEALEFALGVAGGTRSGYVTFQPI